MTGRRQRNGQGRSKATRGNLTPRKKVNGLRIILEGTRTLPELRQMLMDMVDKLDSHAVTHVNGTYVYLNPCDARGRRVYPRLCPGTLSGFTVPGPYRSMADEKGI